MRVRITKYRVIILLFSVIALQVVTIAARSSISTNPSVTKAAPLPQALALNSFSGDTLVETDQGERPIDQIKVGDKVLAYDETTGKTGYFAVTAAFSHLDVQTEDLTIDNEKVETTPEHPFYTQERGWVKAADLKIGEHVRRADGSYGVVKAKQAWLHVERMYNLTVEGAHTFFVGHEEWLVHNDACYRTGGKNARNLTPRESDVTHRIDPQTGEIEINPK